VWLQLKTECAVLESSHMHLTSALAALEARRKSLEGSEKSLLRTVADLQDQLDCGACGGDRGESPNVCVEATAETETETGSLDALRARDKSLQREVREAREEVCSLKRHFSGLEETGGHFGADDWGNVCDMIAPVRLEDDLPATGGDKRDSTCSVSKYDQALGIVLGDSLGVRVCGSLQTAMRVTAGPAAVTVWPLEHMAPIPTLRPAQFDQFVSLLRGRVAEKDGGDGTTGEARVIDPVSLGRLSVALVDVLVLVLVLVWSRRFFK
jgi:hypothetical protein